MRAYLSVLFIFVVLFGYLTVTSSSHRHPLSKSESLVLTKVNTITIKGPIDESAYSDLVGKMAKFKEQEVLLFIDSPGGSVISALKIMSLIEASKKPVTCLATFAASAAFFIFQTCPVRLVTSSSVIMQHVPSYGVNGEAPNNRSMTNFIEGLSKKMVKIQAKRMDMSVEDFERKIRDDYWLFGKDAVTEKAADRVIEVSCDADSIDATYDRVVQTPFGPITIVWSECPLITNPKQVKMGEEPRSDVESQKLREFTNKVILSREPLKNYPM